jgi:hypothetical protein
MSFPTVVFDQMLRELGELVTYRNAVLLRPEIAGRPDVAVALAAFKEAVSAVGDVASAAGDRTLEVAWARGALARARESFVATRAVWEPPGSSGSAPRPH